MADKIDIYQEERPWGSFRRFTNNIPSTVKIISIKPNEELSRQSHDERSEFWHVTLGSGQCLIDNDKYELHKGDEKFVPIKALHKIIAGAEGIEILEISLGDFDEGDITRYEDKYGRL